MPIQRMTCFKVTNEADIDGFLNQYKVVGETNQKDGKPYLLECSPRKAIDDPRNPGYNFIALTKLASMDDVKYYDESCEAHQKLKDFAKGKVEGPPLVLHVEV